MPLALVRVEGRDGFDELRLGGRVVLGVDRVVPFGVLRGLTEKERLNFNSRKPVKIF